MKIKLKWEKLMFLEIPIDDIATILFVEALGFLALAITPNEWFALLLVFLNITFVVYLLVGFRAVRKSMREIPEIIYLPPRIWKKLEMLYGGDIVELVFG